MLSILPLLDMFTRFDSVVAGAFAPLPLLLGVFSLFQWGPLPKRDFVNLQESFINPKRVGRMVMQIE